MFNKIQNNIIFRAICIALTIALLVNEVSFATDEMRSCLAVPNFFNPPCQVIYDPASGKYDIGSANPRAGLPGCYFLWHLIADALHKDLLDAEKLHQLISEIIAKRFSDDKTISNFDWKNMKHENGEYVLLLSDGTKECRFTKNAANCPLQFEVEPGKFIGLFVRDMSGQPNEHPAFRQDVDYFIDINRQFNFEDASIEQREFAVRKSPADMVYPVLRVSINGCQYKIGKGFYLIVTLKNGKKIYWGGQHNLSYSFFFEHYREKAQGLIDSGGVVWRHIDAHPDLDNYNIESLTPRDRVDWQDDEIFGFTHLTSGNYLRYLIKSGIISHLYRAYRLGGKRDFPFESLGIPEEECELADLASRPLTGGVTDIDIDVVVGPSQNVNNAQSVSVFERMRPHLIAIAEQGDVCFLTNSSELKRIDYGEPCNISPALAVNFNGELIEHLSKKAAGEITQTGDRSGEQPGADDNIPVPEYKNRDEFIAGHTVKFVTHGKEEVRSVQEIMSHELPHAVAAARTIFDIRDLMDKNGAQDKPVIIWQNTRLGELYPHFSQSLKKRLGIVETKVHDLYSAFISGNRSKMQKFRNARYILVKEQLHSSHPGELYGEAESNWDLSVELEAVVKLEAVASQLCVPIAMIDFSANALSQAQKLIIGRERKSRRPLAVIGSKGGGVAGMDPHIFSTGMFFIVHNANLYPDSGNQSYFDDTKAVLERDHVGDVIIASERTSFYDAFRRVYGDAVEDAFLQDESRQTPVPVPESTGKNIAPVELPSREGVLYLKKLIAEKRKEAGGRPMFVGIDGDAGVGKTTLASSISDGKGVLVIEADKFRDGASLIDWEKLRRHIDERITGKDDIVVVIEGFKLFMDMGGEIEEEHRRYVINTEFDIRVNLTADLETKCANLKERYPDWEDDHIKDIAEMGQGDYTGLPYHLILDNSLQNRLEAGVGIDLLADDAPDAPGIKERYLKPGYEEWHVDRKGLYREDGRTIPFDNGKETLVDALFHMIKEREFDRIFDNKRLYVHIPAGDISSYTVRSDAFERISEILLHVLDNANKYSQGSDIIVRLEPKGGDIHIEVEDFGIGIPKDSLQKIGMVGYRAPNAIAVTNDGSGLGISSVYFTVEDMNGSYIIESEENKRTKFICDLPDVMDVKLSELARIKKQVMEELESEISAHGYSADSYEKFVQAEAEKYGVRLSRRPLTLKEFHDKEKFRSILTTIKKFFASLMRLDLKTAFVCVLDFGIHMMYLATQQIGPVAKVKFTADGKIDEVVYSPDRGKLYPTHVLLWIAVALVMLPIRNIIAAIMAGYFPVYEICLMLLVPISGYIVTSSALLIITRYFNKAEGHELTHVLQTVLLERIRQELDQPMNARDFQVRIPAVVRQRAVHAHPKIRREPPTKDQAERVVDDLFNEVSKNIPLYETTRTKAPLAKAVRTFIRSLESRFFDVIGKKGLLDVPKMQCIIRCNLLARILSSQFGLPIGGENPDRIEVVPGYYSNREKEELIYHQWIAIYHNNIPVLFVDPSYGQFNSQYDNKIVMYAYNENRLFEAYRLAEARASFTEKLDEWLAVKDLKMSIQEAVDYIYENKQDEDFYFGNINIIRACEEYVHNERIRSKGELTSLGPETSALMEEALTVLTGRTSSPKTPDDLGTLDHNIPLIIFTMALFVCVPIILYYIPHMLSLLSISMAPHYTAIGIFILPVTFFVSYFSDSVSGVGGVGGTGGIGGYDPSKISRLIIENTRKILPADSKFGKRVLALNKAGADYNKKLDALVGDIKAYLMSQDPILMSIAGIPAALVAQAIQNDQHIIIVEIERFRQIESQKKVKPIEAPSDSFERSRREDTSAGYEEVIAFQRDTIRRLQHTLSRFLDPKIEKGEIEIPEKGDEDALEKILEIVKKGDKSSVVFADVKSRFCRLKPEVLIKAALRNIFWERKDKGLIGKYVIYSIKESEDFPKQDKGTLIIDGFDIDKRKDVKFTVPARRGPPSVFSNFRKTGITEIDTALQAHLDSYRGNTYVLEPNDYGIDGIGTKDILAIADSLKDNDIALFHELVHSSGIDITPYIKDRTTLDIYISEKGREYRQIPSLRSHYALRVFQREMWPDDDSALTILIREKVSSTSFEESLYQAVRQHLIEKTDIAEGAIRKISDDEVKSILDITASEDSRSFKVRSVNGILSRFSLGAKNINTIINMLARDIQLIRLNLIVDEIAGTAEDMRKLFSRNRWGGKRPEYGVGEARECVRKAIAKIVNRMLELYAGDSGDIVDVGAGQGWLESLVESRWRENGRIVPFDQNPDFLAHIKDKGLCERTIEGNVYDLSRHVQNADTIIASDSYDTFVDLEKAIEESYKALRPGGRLIVFQSLRVDPVPIYEAMKELGIVYCPRVDAFFADKETMRIVMRPYVIAALKNKLGDMSDEHYQAYTKLRMQLELNMNTQMFHPRLVTAIERAGFNILKEGGEISNTLSDIEERHRRVRTDDGMADLPPGINGLDLKHGKTSLYQDLPNIPRGKILEQAEIIVVVAEKPRTAGEDLSVVGSGGVASSGILRDVILKMLPEDDQRRIDSAVRFMEHVIMMGQVSDVDFERLSERPDFFDFDDIPGEKVSGFVRERKEAGAYLGKFDRSWVEEYCAFLMREHGSFRTCKFTPQIGSRIFVEAYRRGIPFSDDLAERVKAVDKFMDFLLFNTEHAVPDRLLRAATVLEGWSTQGFLDWAWTALDRVALYAERQQNDTTKRICHTFLSYSTENLFESMAMAHAFMFNRSILEGFLSGDHAEENDVGVVYLLNGSAHLYNQALQIAEARGIDTSRMHAVYFNRRISEQDPDLLKKYLEQEGIAKYRKLVIVDTGFQGTSACQLVDVLETMPDSPEKIHGRLLCLNTEIGPYQHKNMDVAGWNSVMEGLAFNRYMEGYAFDARNAEALVFVTQMLDNGMPVAYRSPVSLEDGDDGRVRPVLTHTETPIFAAIAGHSIRKGTEKLLSEDYSYPHAENDLWDLWWPDGISESVRQDNVFRFKEPDHEKELSVLQEFYRLPKSGPEDFILPGDAERCAAEFVKSHMGKSVTKTEAVKFGMFTCVVKCTYQEDGQEKYLAVNISSSNKSIAEVVRADFANLSYFYRKGLRKYLPAPYSGGWVKAPHDGEEEDVFVFACEWLDGYEELHVTQHVGGNRFLRWVYDHEKALQFRETSRQKGGIDLETAMREQVKEYAPLSQEESDLVAKEVVKAIAYHYDIDTGTTIANVLIDNGDFIYRKLPDGSIDVRLITVRWRKQGVPKERFLEFLFNLVALDYESPYLDSSYPFSVCPQVQYPVNVVTPEIVLEGLKEGLIERHGESEGLRLFQEFTVRTEADAQNTDNKPKKAGKKTVDRVDLVKDYYKLGETTGKLTAVKTTGKGVFCSSPNEALADVSRIFLQGQSGKRVLDLGSGTGKAVAWFSIYAGHVKGIEFGSGLHDQACVAIKDLDKRGAVDKNKIELTQGDFFNEDFSQYDLIYIYWPYSQSESGPMAARLTEKLNREMKKDAVFVICCSSHEKLAGFAESLDVIDLPYDDEHISESIQAYRLKHSGVSLSDSSDKSGPSDRVNKGEEDEKGLIGKYVVRSVKEGMDLLERGKGALIVEAFDVEKKEVVMFALPARRGPPFLFSGFRKTDIPEIDTLLESHLYDFQGNTYILEPNDYGIDGIGTKNILAIADPLSHNDIALFHELAHSAGINIIPYIEGGKEALDAYIAAEGKEHRQVPEMRSHYALRLFQRQMWPGDDMYLTLLIKSLTRSAEAAAIIENPYIKYDMAVKDMINPTDKSLRALYGGAGTDLTNFLFSTNADTGYFVSFYGDLKTWKVKECLEDPQYLDNGYIRDLDPVYPIDKKRFGYTVVSSLRKRISKYDVGEYIGIEEDVSWKRVIASLAYELHMLNARSVEVDDVNGSIKISFKWAYPGKGERTYSVTLINADITRPKKYPDILREVLAGGIDVYYQKAGQNIPGAYSVKGENNFIRVLRENMNPGAFFVTDDHSYVSWKSFFSESRVYSDRGRKFPLECSEKTIPGLDGFEKEILSLRTSGKRHVEPYYGWYMRIRQILPVMGAPFEKGKEKDVITRESLRVLDILPKRQMSRGEKEKEIGKVVSGSHFIRSRIEAGMRQILFLQWKQVRALAAFTAFALLGYAFGWGWRYYLGIYIVIQGLSLWMRFDDSILLATTVQPMGVRVAVEYEMYKDRFRKYSRLFPAVAAHEAIHYFSEELGISETFEHVAAQSVQDLIRSGGDIGVLVAYLNEERDFSPRVLEQLKRKLTIDNIDDRINAMRAIPDIRRRWHSAYSAFDKEHTGEKRIVALNWAIEALKFIEEYGMLGALLFIRNISVTGGDHEVAKKRTVEEASGIFTDARVNSQKMPPDKADIYLKLVSDGYLTEAEELRNGDNEEERLGPDKNKRKRPGCIYELFGIRVYMKLWAKTLGRMPVETNDIAVGRGTNEELLQRLFVSEEIARRHRVFFYHTLITTSLTLFLSIGGLLLEEQKMFITFAVFTGVLVALNIFGNVYPLMLQAYISARLAHVLDGRVERHVRNIENILGEIEHLARPVDGEDSEEEKRRLILCYDRVLKLLSLQGLLNGQVVYPAPGLDVLAAHYARATFLNREDLRCDLAYFINKYTDWEVGEHDLDDSYSAVESAANIDNYRGYKGPKTVLMKGFRQSTRYPILKFLLDLNKTLKTGDRIVLLWDNDIQGVPPKALLKLGYRVVDDWLPQEALNRLKSVLERIGTSDVSISSPLFQTYFLIPNNILIFEKTENVKGARRAVSGGQKTDGAVDKTRGLIGKYLVTSDVEFMPTEPGRDDGILVFMAKDIEHPQKEASEIILSAKQTPKKVFSNFRKSKVHAIDNAVSYFYEKFQGDTFIIEPNIYGIDGIGTGQCLAIVEPLKDNDIAIFHEVAHGSGIDVTPYLDGGEDTLSSYINQQGKYYRQIPEMRLHYALRLLQKQKWGSDDAALTNIIRGLERQMAEAKPSPKKKVVQEEQPPVVKKPVRDKQRDFRKRIATLIEDHHRLGDALVRDFNNLAQDVQDVPEAARLVAQQIEAAQLFNTYYTALQYTRKKTYLHELPDAVDFRDFIENLPQPYRNLWLRNRFYWAQHQAYIRIADQELDRIQNRDFHGDARMSEPARVIDYILQWFGKAKSEWIQGEKDRIRQELDDAIHGLETEVQEEVAERSVEPTKPATSSARSWRTLLNEAKVLFAEGNLAEAKRLNAEAFGQAVNNLKGKHQRRAIEKIQAFAKQIAENGSGNSIKLFDMGIVILILGPIAIVGILLYGLIRSPNFRMIIKVAFSRFRDWVDLNIRRLPYLKGQVTMAVPDLHGDYAVFLKYKKSADSLRVKRTVYLGDVIDRGRDGVRIYDELERLVADDKAVVLLGNHEVTFLRAMMGDVHSFERFMRENQGGIETLRGAGIEVGDFNRMPTQEIYDLHPEMMNNARLKHLSEWLLSNARLHFVDEHGTLYVHAGMQEDFSFGFAEGIGSLDRGEECLRSNNSYLVALALEVLDEDPNSVVWTRDVLGHGDPDEFRRIRKLYNERGIDRIVHGHSILPFPSSTEDFVYDMDASNEDVLGMTRYDYALVSGPKGADVWMFSSSGSKEKTEINVTSVRDMYAERSNGIPHLYLGPEIENDGVNEQDTEPAQPSEPADSTDDDRWSQTPSEVFDEEPDSESPTVTLEMQRYDKEILLIPQDEMDARLAALDTELKDFEGSKTPKSLILFADDILKNAVLFDLENTLKRLTKEGGILKGGKIVLYTKDEDFKEYVDKLKKFIEYVAKDVNVIIVSPDDIYNGPVPQGKNEAEEIGDLLKELERSDRDGDRVKDIDRKDVLAIIRGNGCDWPVLFRDYDQRIPLIILNDNAKGLFSFAEAITLAIRTQKEDSKKPAGWIKHLDCIKDTEAIYQKYVLYRDRILTSL